MPRDPIFHRPTKTRRKINIKTKDYTKFVKWTPLKATIFGVCLSIPYLAAVVAIALTGALGAASIMLFLGIVVGLVTAILYWFARNF